ncbi:MAG: plastocyanin/azurin family copper-binding protein, partial [Dehalococcoidia bacterium]
LERAGLPGAPLNVVVNRPPELTGGALEAQAKRFHDTTVCGRVGTVMPPWSIDQGGALNFFQIEQLVLLITSQYSEEGWGVALEDANHADAFAFTRLLTEPLSAEGTTLHVNEAVGIEPSDDAADVLIRIGPETLEDPYEVMRVVKVDPEARTIEVERGKDVAGTEAMEHEVSAEVYRGPIPPGNTTTGDPESQGFPPCGQKAAPAPAGGGGTDGGGTGVSLDAGGSLSMGDDFFEFDGQQNPAFTLSVGNTAALTLPNAGSNIHNMRTAGADGEYNTDDDQVSDPDLVAGGEGAQIEISFATAGTYAYRCDFHPTDMAGEITVQ